MASFRIAYEKYIQPNEGGYANKANDKGGETYAGIARKMNPTWKGWEYIDLQKRTSVKPIKSNTKFPAIQYLVADFYNKRWDSIRLSEINSQEVANLIFDFHVHSGNKAVRYAQAAVNLKPDGVMGPATIQAINKADATQVFTTILNNRKAFLDSLIKRDPTQKDFQAGWTARLSKFYDVINTIKKPENAIPIGIVLVGFGLTAWLLFGGNVNSA
ncbi:MAG TPA: glycosyl hydrolase 108 family protein [Cyclobacteriaceae bacterium]